MQSSYEARAMMWEKEVERIAQFQKKSSDLDRRRFALDRKAGPISLGSVHLLYYDVALHVHALAEAVEIDESRFFMLLRRLASSFCDTPNVCSQSVQSSHNGPNSRHLYRYPAEKYYAEYKDNVARFREHCEEGLRWSVEKQFLFNRFSYVVSEDGRWRVSRDPMSATRLFLGIDADSSTPPHPALAEKFDFDVRAAGEVAFLWRKSDSSATAVLINSISGHYLPKELSAQNLTREVQSALGEDCSVNVIAIGNNGLSITGSLFRAGLSYNVE